jgi:hypothetical protein
MKTTVSTDLLLRVAQATPEQQAAIERILCVGGMAGRAEVGTEDDVRATLLRIEEKIDAVLKAHRVSGVELFKAHLPEQEESISEPESAQVFRLFGELLAMGADLVAPPARVFDLMVFKKMTKAEAALECKCAASLITKRVALIESHFQMPVERLCAFASDLKERQRTVKGDRYARKKRGAVHDEREQYDDGDKPCLKEDDDGYLAEERQGND